MAQGSNGTRSGGPPLLASRLTVPGPPEPLVLRPRLLHLLDEGVGGPVTLVRAPAGWGKTTLLAAWVRAAGRAGDPAWLSVEVGDTGERLWSYLAAALVPPDDTDESGHMPPIAPDRPAERLERLAATLADRDRPVVLVLDDLHRITDPADLAGLEFLLRHGGGRLRLVVAARTDPALPLHHWRLRGELTGLDADDLAFTTDEVADLLTAHGVAVPPAAVPALRARTGGWPAGLRFAALAARAATDPARLVERYAGDEPDVADYLRDEVLAALTDEETDLLRRSAVTEAVCGELADALTGRPGADGVLAGLVRGCGFVRPDDLRPGWYRCQRMLTDLLRADLARQPADELRELHRRAAGWYADHGRPAEALRHALAAGEWDRATGLVLTEWPELVPYDPGPGPAGREPGPPPAGPPAERLARDPELGLALAVERAAAGDHGTATGHLRHAVAAARPLPVPRRDRFRRLATALEITLARLAGDHTGVRAAVARLRATLDGPPAAVARLRDTPGTPPVGPADDPRSSARDRADVHLVADTAEALADLAEGHPYRAGSQLRRLAGTAREAGRSGTELVCRSRAALAAAWWGDLRDAELAAGETLGGAAAPGDRGHAYLALALVALYRDRPGEAEAYLSRVDLPGAGPVPVAMAAYCRAHLLRERGDLAGAHRLLAQARESRPLIPGASPSHAGQSPSSPTTVGAGRQETTEPSHAGAGRQETTEPSHAGARRHEATEPSHPGAGGPEVTDRLLAAEAELDAAHGDLTTARDLLRPSVDRPEPAVAYARVELRAGDPRAAAAALPAWDAPTAGSWPLPVRLDAGLLDVLLARQAGDPRRAGRLLERVLELAGPEGHRRVFTHAEPAVREVLAEHLDSGTAYWPFVAELLHDTDPGHGAGGGRSAGGADHGPGDRFAGQLTEPLTERELTVLRYLQSILSNVEIASELSLSVNTVKTHVRNIYRKLDATRRREAVRRARELHLL
ncbi:LuxR C-terminal-related transcriptional regulator [Micromonospora cathayae]|uniref:LuxR C-terminal-related transcriptional regulator n=1 Tax=Micromonospora cathayae TaxID=3028804 RepID=A0ABY7ZS10_9ACTN|nr:LuxR C-terminal-related transcriptional regulator [Micromonospora sp. HUAS 3]WDZ84639.1 LuxR C-terminal-related transcriptional regulator [Micromonospora sp. HUAS 3]